jgi:hypothetical protein
VSVGACAYTDTCVCVCVCVWGGGSVRHQRTADVREGGPAAEYSAADNLSYVVSPRDIVIAKPRDLDDHVAWLLERQRYGAGPSLLGSGAPMR